MAATKTLEERKNDFINRLKDLYPDYRLISDYVNGDTFIELLHLPTKEVWKTKPRYLDGKRQAPGVARSNKKVNTKKLTHEQYEEKFYKKWDKNKYILKSTYTKLSDKIEVLHTECGKIFTPTANNMLYTNKLGCPHCFGKNRNSKESYQEKFNSDKELKEYTILNTFSKDGHIYGKVQHNCDLCDNHIFTIRLSDMVSKHRQRCPKCKDILQESKAVKDIKKYLIENNIKFIQEAKFKSCRNINLLPFDFYLPDYRAIIEYDGKQHFKPSFNSDLDISKEKLRKTQYNDNIKNEWCKKNKVNLLRISYKENHLSKVKKFLDSLI